MLVNNKLDIDSCPFCNSKNIICKGNIVYPKNLLFSTTEIKLTDNPSLLYCNNCMSGFTNNIIDEHTAMNLYRTSDSSSRWNQGLDFTQIKPRKMFDFLKKYIFENDNLLDIGANKGELLDFCKNNIGANTSAYELSEVSQSKLAGKGHNVFNSLEEIEKGTIDVICLFDVVEHLYNLEDMLLSLYDLLTINGKVIILTGNINSHSAKLASNNWWYLKAPEHIRFPSIGFFKSLKKYKYIIHITTFNANGYKSTILDKVKTLIKLILKRKNYHYNGIPLLSDDHYIIILEKQ